MPHPTTLILAHADHDLRIALAAQFDLDGYVVHEADRASSVRSTLTRVRPDAIVLGHLERSAAAPLVLRAIREGLVDGIEPTVAIVTMGNEDGVEDLRAYEDGSDHHVPETIAYPLLRAILDAVVRRVALATSPTSPIEVGSLVIDVTGHEVRFGGDLVKLTPLEYELLVKLASEPRRLFKKAELLEAIWGYGDSSATRTLDSHAVRLRQRLAKHGATLIANQWGVGYRLLP